MREEVASGDLFDGKQGKNSNPNDRQETSINKKVKESYFRRDGLGKNIASITTTKKNIFGTTIRRRPILRTRPS